MILPDWLLIFMPKKQQRKQISDIWDSKTNEQIIIAYKDAQDWIKAGEFLKGETSLKIANDCKIRLEKYIMPQIKKRGIDFSSAI